MINKQKYLSKHAVQFNRFRNKTSATEFKVLWFICSYAVKFIGAAHLKLSTIAEGIGMSTKTGAGLF